MTRLLGVLGFCCVLSAACSESPTSPTSAVDSAPLASTRVFTGWLAPGESRFYSFTISSAGSVGATLAALTTGSVGSVWSGGVQLAIGVPAGHGCAPLDDVVVATPALTPQIVRSLLPGVFCVRIADVGELPGPMIFTVRVTLP